MDKSKIFRPLKTAVASKRYLFTMAFINAVIGLYFYFTRGDLLISAIFLLFALYFGVYQGRKAWKLARDGTTTSGIVIDKWEDNIYIRLFRGGNNWIAYEYLDGQRLKQSVEKAIFDNLSVGSTVAVCYLSRDSGISHLDLSSQEIEVTATDLLRKLSLIVFGSLLFLAAVWWLTQ